MLELAIRVFLNIHLGDEESASHEESFYFLVVNQFFMKGCLYFVFLK